MNNYCRRCNKIVSRASNPNYQFRCFHCNRDILAYETYQADSPRTSEGLSMQEARIQEITHDYECNECGNPATREVSRYVTTVYEILPDGNTVEQDQCFDDAETEYYCDEC